MPRAAVPPHGGVLRSLDERVLREIAGRNHRRLDRRLLRAVPLRHRDLLLPVLRDSAPPFWLAAPARDRDGEARPHGNADGNERRGRHAGGVGAGRGRAR